MEKNSHRMFPQLSSTLGYVKSFRIFHKLFLKSEVLFVKNSKIVVETFLDFQQLEHVKESFDNYFRILHEKCFRFLKKFMKYLKTFGVS